MINQKIFTAAIFLILFSVEVSGQEFVYGTEVFQGLKTMGVDITINDTAEGFISSDQIETYVELMLRRNGIQINGYRANALISILALEHTLNSKSVGFTVCTSLEIREAVTLNRDPSKWTFGTTKKYAEVIMSFGPNRSEAAQHISQVVRNLVDQFSNEYLTANPR